MPTITKRKSRRTGAASYTATVRRPEGSSSKTFTSKKQATDWAADQESGLRKGTEVIGDASKTIKDALDAYRLSRKRGRDRELLIDWWQNKLGTRTVKSIRRPELFDIKDELVKAGLGASTTNHHFSVLRSALTIAVARGWIARNPATDAGHTDAESRLARKEPKGKVRYLSDDERQKLLDACRDSPEPILYAMVLAALSTGARAGELLNLEWQDVDFARGMARIRESKNGEPRSVPLRGPIIPVLTDLKTKAVRHVGAPDYVFRSLSGAGGRSFNYRKPWLVAIKAAKLDTHFRFHDLRHTAASYMVQANASLFAVGKVLGHRTPQMTQRYAHLAEENIAAAGDLLGARLTAKKDEATTVQ